MADALEGFKHRGEGIPLIGMAFDRNENVEGAVMINDAHVFSSRLAHGVKVSADLIATSD